MALGPLLIALIACSALIAATSSAVVRSSRGVVIPIGCGARGRRCIRFDSKVPDLMQVFGGGVACDAYDRSEERRVGKEC